MGGRSWLLIWRGRRLCEGFVLLFSSPLFYFFIFFFLFAGTLFGSRLCRGRLNTSRLRILLLIVRRGQNGMNLIRTSKLISAFNARPRDSQRDPCRHFPCNYGTPGADKGSLAYIVLVFPFWAVVSAMARLGQGPLPGLDWLALFTPSERLAQALSFHRAITRWS